MIEFPTPLTEKALRDLMKDERYWRTSHLEHVAYRDKIQEGFETLYGTEPAKLDATGRVINEDGPGPSGPTGE